MIGSIEDGVKTRSRAERFAHCAFVSQLEPKNAKEACVDDAWIMAMQEELQQFERSKVWELVPRPKNHQVIGTNGSSRINWMKKALWFATRQDS